MQVNVTLIVSVLIGTIALAPRPAPSADAYPARGAWGGAVVSEWRAPAGSDTTWDLSPGRARVESRVERGGSAHRVVAAWTALAESLVPGEAVSLTATALVLEAGVDADCTVELVTWQGDLSERDGAPHAATRLVGAAVPAGEPTGAVAQGIGAWRVPAPERAPGRALHVRVTVTHRGNAFALTRSYAWMPAGPQAAD